MLPSVQHVDYDAEDNGFILFVCGSGAETPSDNLKRNITHMDF